MTLQKKQICTFLVTVVIAKIQSAGLLEVKLMFHEKLTVPLKLDDVHVYVQYDLVPTFIDDHAETNKCLGITTKKFFYFISLLLLLL